MNRFRLGTRSSALARWQAEYVAARLQKQGVDVELTPLETQGDLRHGAIRDLGGEGVFTKEIQRALLDGRIDLAVHSLKDLPTCETAGLVLAAVPERGPVHDVLVSDKNASLAELPPGALVGTGSLRRRAQLLHARGDLQMKDVRGNVETRLRKLREGDYDALVLAEAGLRRLGLDARITQVLPREIMLPAVGQGALALETRSDDRIAIEAAALLDHAPTHAAVTAERAMLAALHGGCLAPIAALACVDRETLSLTGRVVGCDGVEWLEAGRSASPAEAAQLGQRVAQDLLDQGAELLIAAARK